MGARWLLGLLAAASAASGAELFNDKVAILDPFPREVARGKTIVLKGTCRGAFKVPELILIAPRGKTYKNEEFEINGPAFEFKVRFEEGTGPYRLELIAHTPDATRSAARFTIYHGVPKPEVEPPEPPPTGPRTPYAIHAELLEKRFQRVLNDFRRSIECEPVGWNEAVAARAREHAARMVQAQRRQHRFGGVGVLEMLTKDGAGPGGLSGPAEPWGRMDTLRPFPPPSPGHPSPKVVNRISVHLVAGDSLEEVFERHFVREAAFRICAADPHCLEVGIGAARAPAPPPVPGKPPPAAASQVFYCVCFVQVNEKPVIRAQDEAFDDLHRRARIREPEILRALGRFGRPKAKGVLEDALDDARPGVAAAALDGYLLLDEVEARAELAKRRAPLAVALEQGRYADAALPLEPFRHVLFDKEIALAYDSAVREAQAAARKELAEIAAGPPEKRDARAADLKRRTQGLGMDELIDKALADRPPQ